MVSNTPVITLSYDHSFNELTYNKKCLRIFAHRIPDEVGVVPVDVEPHVCRQNLGLRRSEEKEIRVAAVVGKTSQIRPSTLKWWASCKFQSECRLVKNINSVSIGMTMIIRCLGCGL